MRKFSRNQTRFFLRHRDKGIPHLIMAVAIIRAIIFFVSTADPSGLLRNNLYFSAPHILSGEVWRLVSFVFVPDGSVFGVVLETLFYIFMDQAFTARFGTLKCNTIFLTSVILLDLFGIGLFFIDPAGFVNVVSLTCIMLDFCLVMVFAGSAPNAGVMFMGLIPLKMKYLAWLDLGYIIYYAIQVRSLSSLICLVPILVLCLFQWSDIPDMLPEWMRNTAVRTQHKAQRSAARHRQQAGKPPIHEVKRDYHHKCTVCGRTDVSNPELEFRYCSRCSGYHCYCTDHINNHAHIIDTNVKE